MHQKSPFGDKKGRCWNLEDYLMGAGSQGLVNPFNTLKSLNDEGDNFYHSLPSLEETLGLKISKLPISIRIMLESVLRNCDGKRVRQEDLLRLAHWNGKKPDEGDVPFVVSRVILQDFTGVPLLVDLAAMRDAVAERKGDAKIIEPIVPVDLVVDHSVQVDRAGTDDAYLYNLEIEFRAQQESVTEFLNWGQQAFRHLKSCRRALGSSTR